LSGYRFDIIKPPINLPRILTKLLMVVLKLKNYKFSFKLIIVGRITVKLCNFNKKQNIDVSAINFKGYSSLLY